MASKVQRFCEFIWYFSINFSRRSSTRNPVLSATSWRIWRTWNKEFISSTFCFSAGSTQPDASYTYIVGSYTFCKLKTSVSKRLNAWRFVDSRAERNCPQNGKKVKIFFRFKIVFFSFTLFKYFYCNIPTLCTTSNFCLYCLFICHEIILVVSPNEIVYQFILSVFWHLVFWFHRFFQR